ncbi:GGDEF domain-containing protein [Thalassotalea sp. G2M2-11]|uniref:GGDEF domain-containing protein n=1 Tax=Thalassotalea sp. G2M2-11 TaxID=2787627 RepID=UPI0019CFE2EA|nr:GGDEF domain-containing protein [Thalassotalea sp. G2M2-11]
MYEEVFESIIKITKKQDSDEFSVSVVATIAEIIPKSIVALFRYSAFAEVGYQCVTSLTIDKSNKKGEQYQWEVDLPSSSLQYIDEYQKSLTQLTEFSTDDGRYHVFIPIEIDGKIVYGIEISSPKNFKKKLDMLSAITKVCNNFYTILSFSEVDSLTGLYNRRTYDNKLNSLLKNQQATQQGSEHQGRMEDENARLVTHETHSWLAIIDIDLFKKVNDKYGHLYGDEVLLSLSQLMQKSFRKNDLLFRFGGEEFVIILEPISFEQAENVLVKFKDIVEGHPFPMVERITISCGFAKISEKDHPKTVFDNADKALYYAKESGRNRVCSYETLVKMSLISDNAEEGEIELF